MSYVVLLAHEEEVKAGTSLSDILVRASPEEKVDFACASTSVCP